MARAESDLTLQELAEAAGRALDTVSRLENLKRGADPKTIFALARALGTSYGALVGFSADFVAEGRPDQGYQEERDRSVFP